MVLQCILGIKLCILQGTRLGTSSKKGDAQNQRVQCIQERVSLGRGMEVTWLPPADSTLSPNSMAVMQMRSSSTRKITSVPRIPSISS